MLDAPDAFYILALTLPYIVCLVRRLEENSSLPSHQSLEKLIKYFLSEIVTPESLVGYVLTHFPSLPSRV